MKTARELYQAQHTETSNVINRLWGCYYNHVPEAIPEGGGYDDIESTRIEIRYLANQQIDERRCWQIATVWFDDYPVMIIQNAGREGDDFSRRLVTNAPAFMAMCQHLRALTTISTEPEEYPLDEQNLDLTHFYNGSLPDRDIIPIEHLPTTEDPTTSERD